MNKEWPWVGALYEPGNACVFTVWAPLKNKVALQLNDKVFPMERDGQGYWQTTVKGVAEGNRYWFIVDDRELLPDPASRWQPDGVHGASAVADTAFNWTDEYWKGLGMDDLVIYELHTGLFTPAGNFAGIIEKLGYLQQLGITAIELMPVAEFPGTRNWGYDGVFPFAVHTAYGGITGLKELVNAAHRHGIAVILDVVYNHFGPEGNYFAEYGPYFTDKYKGNWGNVINYDDAYCDGVRQLFWQNALMWLDEFHIDGLRLDAVHAIWDNSAHHFMAVLKEHVTALAERTGRKKLLIAELDLNNPRYIQSPQIGGYGLDGQWIDEFHHALRTLITGDKSGYYEDFGRPEHLVRALQDGYVYTGQYSVNRKKRFGVYPRHTSYHQFVVFSQNHDQAGNRPLGERLTTQVSFEALKLMAATILLSPYVPLLFMGEEYGETNPFQYFISHTEPELVEMVRRGRKEEFAYFFGDQQPPDPQSENTFQQCKLSWQYAVHESACLLAFYQFLIAFRKNSPAMQGRERDNLTLLSTGDEYLIGFRRSNGIHQVLAFLNFNKEDKVCSWPLPVNAWQVLDSAAEEWGGPGVPAPKGAGEEGWPIRAESVIVFEIPGTV